MKRNILLIAGLFFAGFLAACGSEPAAQLPIVAAAEEAANESTAAEETAVDEQGAVTVSVTPVDLEQEVSELAFEVAMNTHSVDLSMDLAELATLTTDNGRTVSAKLWDAPLKLGLVYVGMIFLVYFAIGLGILQAVRFPENPHFVARAGA